MEPSNLLSSLGGVSDSIDIKDVFQDCVYLVEFLIGTWTSASAYIGIAWRAGHDNYNNNNMSALFLYSLASYNFQFHNSVWMLENAR